MVQINNMMEKRNSIGFYGIKFDNTASYRENS